MNRRWADLYSGLSVILLNTAILFVVLNLAAALWLAWRGEPPRPGALGYSWEELESVYPDLERSELEQLLTETWNREYEYEPYTQFRERPFSGRFVNVDERGFRISDPQPEWPPGPDRTVVFVFGGSTSFGYGVSDGETIPSAAARALRQKGCSVGTAVYNLARSNYFSTQERILFEQLLAAGSVPDVAVFLDGLNEFRYRVDEPKFSNRLRYFMEENGPQIARRTLKHLPLVQLLLRARRARPEPLNEDTRAEAVDAHEVLQRWLTNRRMIRALAAEFGVEVVFVWQPVPIYPPGSDASSFLDTGRRVIGNQEALAEGYRIMAGWRDEWQGTREAVDLLWLADLSPEATEPPYVDRVHYSPSFSRQIGTALAQHLKPLVCSPSAPVRTQGPE